MGSFRKKLPFPLTKQPIWATTVSECVFKENRLCQGKKVTEGSCQAAGAFPFAIDKREKKVYTVRILTIRRKKPSWNIGRILAFKSARCLIW